MKPGLPDNPKVAHLADRLGIPEAHALGILVWLWDKVGSTCDTGILRGWTAKDIARLVRWTKKSSALLDALYAEGWLDRAGDGTALFLVHDWPEEAPRHIAQKWVRAFGLGESQAPEKEARTKMRELHDQTIGDRSLDDRRSSEDRSAIPSVLYGTELDGTGRSGADRASGPNRKAGIEAKGTGPGASAPPPPPRKPITEQKGIAGDLARLWAEVYKRVPAWGSGVSAIHELAKDYPEDEIRGAFARYLAEGDQYVCDAAHPPRLFRSQYDRWAVEERPEAIPRSLPPAPPGYQSGARFRDVDYGESDVCLECAGYLGHEPGCAQSVGSKFEIRVGASKDV